MSSSFSQGTAELRSSLLQIILPFGNLLQPKLMCSYSVIAGTAGPAETGLSLDREAARGDQRLSTNCESRSGARLFEKNALIYDPK